MTKAHIIPGLAGIAVFAIVWGLMQFLVLPLMGLTGATAGLVKLSGSLVCGMLVNNWLYRRAVEPEQN
ncbi:MAG: hypothetical protein ACR2O4_16930 [Hyphomicrobiaceae bacterium]